MQVFNNKVVHNVVYLLCRYQGCTEPEFTVQGLTPDHEYLFRVAAVNSNGVGEYLTASSSIVARYPFGELAILTV